MERCVLNVLVTIPACSHERPGRHAHCRVRDDGVPVLHVEPIPARLRQLRVVVQELEQDAVQAVTPRPEPQHAAMSDVRLGIKPTERAIHCTKKKEGTFNYRNISTEGIILHCSFILIQKIRNRVKLQILQFYINSKKFKLQHVRPVIILSKMVRAIVGHDLYPEVITNDMMSLTSRQRG